MKAIKDLAELKREAAQGIECVISLNYGLVSRKLLWYSKRTNRWTVFNFIDSSKDRNLTTRELERNTNIIKALRFGALYQTQL